MKVQLGSIASDLGESHPSRSVRDAVLMIGTATAVLVAAPAHAYLDPGTGSIILQGIVAGVAAAFAYLGMYWQRVKDFVIRHRSKIGSQKARGDESPGDDPT